MPATPTSKKTPEGHQKTRIRAVLQPQEENVTFTDNNLLLFNESQQRKGGRKQRPAEKRKI